MKKGKFIVIDGTDGSGKATQVKLLVEKLKKAGKKVKTIDFPQYYDNFFGKFVGECLRGEYGNFLEVNPYIASVVYAADRWESGEAIKKWLTAGNIIIADRYASSNQIHQGGKLKNEKDRKKFLDWLEKMEFEAFRIPKPNAIIYLNVPVSITQKLLEEKAMKNKKKYLKGKKDLAESSEKHLEESRESAIKLVRKNNNWINIDCVKNGKLMERDEISEIVFKKINKLI